MYCLVIFLFHCFFFLFKDYNTGFFFFWFFSCLGFLIYLVKKFFLVWFAYTFNYVLSCSAAVLQHHFIIFVHYNVYQCKGNFVSHVHLCSQVVDISYVLFCLFVSHLFHLLPLPVGAGNLLYFQQDIIYILIQQLFNL